MSVDHQERIRQILKQIEEEFSKTKTVPPKPKNQNNPSSIANNTSPAEPSKKEIELSNSYKQRAINAHKQNKIFTVHGNYITIRKALVRRGWIEKLYSGRIQKLEKLSHMRLLKSARKGNDFEVAILSKLVQPYPANFIWQPKYFRDLYSAVNPLRNRVRRSKNLDFSTKIGLIGCFENSQWNTIENVAESACVPSYKLGSREDELHFLLDFRITQCISVLVYLIESKTPTELFDKNGCVPINVFEFAIATIDDYCKKLESDFLEAPQSQNDFSKWEQFATNSQPLLKKHQKVIGSVEESSAWVIKALETIRRIQKFKPFLFSYGFRNLWILKPGFQCRGQGILIMDNFYNIVNYAAARPKSNYIVQKYIEKPLLIYKTKFDIRQYMVVAIFDVISIWMYKDCYLRFSSQEFSLGDLRESIHLTNNSIQKKYKNPERDPRLPSHNMWHLSEFKSFLAAQNQSESWDGKIYPGFKRNLISIVLASLEETELTRNSFELYGCDFMIDEKLDPFLIEINSTPDLSPSTSVTAKICPAALEDLMKIVLDHSKNPKVSTGKFELVYQMEVPTNCQNVPELVAVGTAKTIHAPPVSLVKRWKMRKVLKRKVLKKRIKKMKT